ncbi:FtsW/RodA/SpoVE family cell cycle protein [Camelliibacillus cellulosilyticus]|uniref:FtsW/RodA/SpoVE family cell cycle protein n=1 Tax=Camelliibacillus cellulosilyticus TaxID=2174486 RepID=A0ABV9GS85_9BACL
MKSLLAKLDYTLIFIVFLLFCASLITIYKAPLTSDVVGTNLSYTVHQGIWYVIGAVVAIAVFFFDYDRFKVFAWILYGLMTALLLGLFAAQHGLPVPFAHQSHGAYSWYQLPGIGQFQPSEFVKIALILVISRLIFKHNEELPVRTIKDDFTLLGKIILVSLAPLGLVLLQPDLGTALVMVAIIGALVLVSGIRWRIIAGLILAMLLIAGLVVLAFLFVPNLLDHVLQSHQMERFYGWLDPYNHSNAEGFQLINSLNAIGSGQLYGVGLGDSTIYLPESFNDFIFSVVGNVFGFVGASVLIAIYFLLVYRIVNAALKTHDPFGSYICTGIIGMLTFTIFENVGMTIQVLPITGIPLPFMSYGGSSLIANMFAIGLVLSIEGRARKYMFD